jgi:ribosomal protein S18 acetylase RimI-like enzyme
MPPNTIRPFTVEHVEDASELLADRLARQRAAEPLLVLDDPAAALRRLLERGHEGAVAVREGRLEAFILAEFEDDEDFGRNAWVDAAGSATRDPELLRDVYGFLAVRWVEHGYRRHYAVVPVLPENLEPWYRLGFHQMHVAAGIVETRSEPPELPDGVSIREAGIEDLDDIVRIDVLIFEHQRTGPSYGLMEVEADIEDRRLGWAELLKEEGRRHFVAEMAGRIVGHTGLSIPGPQFAIPAGSIELESTAVEPELRVRGIGVALVVHAFAWAHDQGYPVIRTDWRVTNLLASRFWPARGFRPVYLRLHRAIGIG